MAHPYSLPDPRADAELAVMYACTQGLAAWRSFVVSTSSWFQTFQKHYLAWDPRVRK